MSFDLARELLARRLVATLSASTVLPTPQLRSVSRIIERSGIRGEKGLLAVDEACRRGWIGRSGEDVWLTAAGRCLPGIDVARDGGPVRAVERHDTLRALTDAEVAQERNSAA